jgi:hypothetical protein
MKGIGISVIVSGIILVVSLILISIIYLRLIPSLSDYLVNLIKNAVNTIACMFGKCVTSGLWPC